MALSLSTQTTIGTTANYWTVGHLFITGRKQIKVTCTMYLYTSQEAYDNGAERIPDVHKTFEFEAVKTDILRWEMLYQVAKEKFLELRKAEDI